MIYALIAASAVLDRLRGFTTIVGGTFWALLNGWVIAAILGYPLDPVWTPAIAVLFLLGSTWGWGAPMGALLDRHPMDPNGLEWWQVGPMRSDAWMAATVRGIMWGAPLLALAYWIPAAGFVWVAYGIAFPASIYLARFAPKWRWGTSEFLRGGIGAALVALGGSYGI